MAKAYINKHTTAAVAAGPDRGKDHTTAEVVRLRADLGLVDADSDMADPGRLKLPKRRRVQDDEETGAIKARIEENQHSISWRSWMP